VGGDGYGGAPAQSQERLREGRIGSPTRSWPGLVAWVAVTFSAAAVGSRFQPGGWYEDLAKPAWTPPDAVFGPVWTLLYLLMAIAAWLVWRREGLAGAALPLSVFAAQLVANAAWSWVFFGLHRIGWALTVVVALWALIALTLGLFWKRDRLAGALLVPYLLWVGYAAALNLQILRLNA
jgi:translocator protein